MPSPGEVFNPWRRFNGSHIPEAVSRYRGISCGAKIVYGRLCRYAGEDGNAFPAVASLGRECGLSESQARRYIKELSKTGLIRVDAHDGRMNSYLFLWHSLFSGDSGTARKDFMVRRNRSKEGPRPVHICTRVPVQKTEPLPVHICADEESHHQKSQGKEGQALAPVTRVLPRPVPDAEKPGHLKVDDETPPKKAPTTAPYLSLRPTEDTPEREFALRLRERHEVMHPRIDPVRITSCVKKALEPANVQLADFLDYERSKTTAPGAIRNPDGYYVRAAQSMAIASRAATESVILAGRAVMAAIQNGTHDPGTAARCEKCKGGGFLSKIKFCDCAMGRDLARVDRRTPEKKPLGLSSLSLAPSAEGAHVAV